MFRDCEVAKRLWAGMSLGIRCDNEVIIDIKTWIINWLYFFNKNDEAAKRMTEFLTVIWTIWWNGNDMLFRVSTIDFGKVISFYNNIKNSNSSSGDFEGRSAEQELQSMGDSLRYHIMNSFPYNIISNTSFCPLFQVKVDAAWDRSGATGFG